ncbi:MAG: hypothetical protein KIH01_03685 [Candidatus Freyarchaeota archaeon]|nr:hypothetical protein [Candidatus Jordarchaeia archaeon]
MSSSVEVRFQVQCRGVALLRFDYAIGPVVEELFPQGFMPKELTWNLALDMWMAMGSKGMERGYNTVVFLKDVEMFACLVSGGSGEAPYAMAAFFDPGSISGFWNIKDDVVGVLLRRIERVQRGERAEQAVREAYDDVVNVAVNLRKTGGSEAFLEETVDFVSRLVDAVQGLGKEADELTVLVGGYVERIADEARRVGADGALKKIFKLMPLLKALGGKASQ